MRSRWDLLHGMAGARDAVDRLYEDAFFGQGGERSIGIMSLALDVIERGDEYVVKTSLPGVNPGDIDVTYLNGVLTIQGEVKEDKEEKDARYHLRERRWGRFSRSISIPNVNPDEIDASYENGCLTLRLPKAKGSKARRIPVRSGPGLGFLKG